MPTSIDKLKNALNIEDIGDNCLGCAACFSACPRKAISMQENTEGFLYPHLDPRLCVNCGKCSSVCPVTADPGNNLSNKVFAGIHKDFSTWSSSASGGAFRALCELYGDENTYIAGAVFGKDGKNVEHRIVKGVSNASVFSGSKYVQSDMGDTLINVRALLKDGQKVIFSGVPCQIAGLRRFVADIKDKNLLTIDLICHGVGSRKVFRDYLTGIEKRYKSKISDYKFRDKRIRFGVHHLYRMSALFENGKRISSNDDAYTRCFLQTIVCRKSCFLCRFNDLTSESDITIGDFKKQYVKTDAPYDKNGSIIISHTPKGDALCSRLAEVMTMYPVDENAFDYPVHEKIGETRNAFFEEYVSKENDIMDLLEKYGAKPSLKLKIWRCVPDKVRGIIKKLAASK